MYYVAKEPSAPLRPDDALETLKRRDSVRNATCWNHRLARLFYSFRPIVILRPHKFGTHVIDVRTFPIIRPYGSRVTSYIETYVLNLYLCIVSVFRVVLQKIRGNKVTGDTNKQHFYSRKVRSGFAASECRVF